MLTPCELSDNWSKEIFHHVLNNWRRCTKMCAVQVCDATVSKPHYNWLNKWIFHDIIQSDNILQGQ